MTGFVCFLFCFLRKNGSFPFVPPAQNVMRLQDTEHVPLHSKSSCKNIARASGECQ